LKEEGIAAFKEVFKGEMTKGTLDEVIDAVRTSPERLCMFLIRGKLLLIKLAL